MLKKLVNAQKDHLAKHAEKKEERYDKMDNKLYDNYKGVLEPLLMQDEKVIKVYGLMRDFAAVTDTRLIFVDVKGMSGIDKGIVFIPLKNIQEVAIEQNHVSGAIQISTMRSSYILKMLDKNVTARFAKELMQAMR